MGIPCSFCGYDLARSVTSKYYRCPVCDTPRNDAAGYYFIRISRAAFCTLLPFLPLVLTLALLQLFSIIPTWPLWICLAILVPPFGILFLKQDWAISIYISMIDAIDRVESAGKYLDRLIDERASNAGLVAIVVAVLMLAVSAFNSFSPAYLWATLIISIAAFVTAYYLQKKTPRLLAIIGQGFELLSLCVTFLILIVMTVTVICLFLWEMNFTITITDFPFIIGFGTAFILTFKSSLFRGSLPILFRINEGQYSGFGSARQELIRAILLAFFLSAPVFLLELYLFPRDYRFPTYAVLIGSTVVLFLKKDLLSDLWGAKIGSISHLVKGLYSSLSMAILLLLMLFFPLQMYFFPLNMWQESASRSPFFFIVCLFYYSVLVLFILLLLSLRYKTIGTPVFRAIHDIIKGKPG